MATKITMDPIQFSMIWNIIIEKGKKHPQGGYILDGVRTMVTASNNRKLYSVFSNISYVEIGNKIRVYQ
jgi:hypothetical protein